jgi:putative transposase
VTYETIRCWCDKFGRDFAHRVKTVRRKRGSTRHLDEMFITLRGEPYLLWRAVDEHGAELDILVQKRRDNAAAKRFFKCVLRSNPVPRKIVTDQLRSYPAAKAETPELANVKHVFVKAAARLNNRAENSHQPTRERERRMRGFREPKRTQNFPSCFGPIRQHCALRRHLLRASLHREQLAARFVAWRKFTALAQNPSFAF